MNWIKEAESKLRDYAAKERAVMNLNDEIKRLESEMSCVRSAATDGTPVLGGGNCREDALLNNIAKREELKIAIDCVARWLAMVDRALAVLSDEERLILDRFYIHRKRGHVEWLAEQLHIEQAQVYRKKDAVLRKFTLALYGVTET